MKAKPTKPAADFQSALKKNRTGRKPTTGLRLSRVVINDRLEYFRFAVGEALYKRAGLRLGDTMDLQIDVGRRLGRLIKISPVPGEPKGNKLHRNDSTYARTLQARFKVDDDFRELLVPERSTLLKVVEARGEEIVFELPLKPDWKKAALE